MRKIKSQVKSSKVDALSKKVYQLEGTLGAMFEEFKKLHNINDGLMGVLQLMPGYTEAFEQLKKDHEERMEKGNPGLEQLMEEEINEKK